MMRVATNLLVILLALMLAVSTAAAQSLELRLRDGSRWRGQVNDQVEARFIQNGVEVLISGTLVKAERSYVVIKGTIGGVQRERTIFIADLVSMTSTGGGSAGNPSVADPSQPQAPSSGSPAPATGSDAPVASGQPAGVLVLPMRGMVGTIFRHEEIEKIGKKADEYGPGQIIVLLIDSGGGSVIETEKIHQTIMQIRQRHRVIAWIKEAISGGAASASACNEIYFMRQGTMGAMTAFAGTRSLQGRQLEKWIEIAGEWFEAGGRSRYVAAAMIEDQAELSYDKDPVTGDVIFYPDLSGQYVLSRKGENLVFTAETALDCGFSDGTASTEAELAKLLNLPKWHELTDYGRRLADEWKRTCEQAEREIPILLDRVNRDNPALDRQANLGRRIQTLEDLVRWLDRCPNIAEGMLPERAVLLRQIEELRRQLAEMRRR